jgi:hypothetical protein
MFRHLEQALRTIGFLTPDGTEVVMRRLRRLLGRAEMTANEVRLLRGVARQTLWVARRAGLPLADGPEASGTGAASGAEEDATVGDRRECGRKS